MSSQRILTGGIIGEYLTQKSGTVVPPSPSSDITSKLLRYDILNNIWEEKTNCKYNRAGHGQVSYNGKLYIFGGTNGIQFYKYCEEYNIGDDTWTTKSSLSNGRAFFQYVENSGYIYVFGGLTVDSSGQTLISNSVERYDISNNTWASLTNMPTEHGVTMGNAFYYNNNIYILNGYKNSLYTLNDKILIYNIPGDSWTIYEPSDDEKFLLYRALNFGFVKNNKFYGIGGIYYSQDITLDSDQNAIVSENQGIRSDIFVYNPATTEISKAENEFYSIPKIRYGGQSTSVGNDIYFGGGVNNFNNTLKFFEKIDTSSSPFSYERKSNITKGCSYFGQSYYSNYIYISGGVLSRIGENYFRVELDTFPETINLDGKNTSNVSINVYDENGEAPTNLTARIKGVINASDESNLEKSENLILFSKDNISIKNGIGLATILPRADDQSAKMSDNYSNTYTANVSSFILDSVYSGETSPSTSINDDGEISTTNSNTTFNLTIPEGWTIDKIYSTINNISDLTTGGYAILTQITPFLSLIPEFLAGGKSSEINFSATIPWLPVVKNIIEDNEGNYELIREELDKIHYLPPFGGSPIYDAIYKNDDILELDSSQLNKIIYSITDGNNNCSHYTSDEIIIRNEFVSGAKDIPIVFSGLRIIPETMHMGIGENANKEELKNIANSSNGSLLYIYNENDVLNHVKNILNTKGFLGYGYFWFTVDLLDIYRLNTFSINFVLDDIRTNGYFSYQTAKEDLKYSTLSEKLNINTLIDVSTIDCRYIRFFVEFIAEMDPSEYSASKIIPPKMTSVDISYNKPTSSTVIFNKDLIEDDAHQVSIVLDHEKNEDSFINVGVDTEKHNEFNNYEIVSKPTLNNNSKILIPIRKLLNEDEEYSLEDLHSINDIVWESVYGPWPNNSSYSVYKFNTTTNKYDKVASNLYKANPVKGIIVFNTKTSGSYKIAIKNVEEISIAAQIVNRVSGKPLVITGAGYMYSTLAKKQFTKINKIVPEAFNLLLYPLNPDINSIFKASYNYYDINGRTEKGSEIRWYINNVENTDLYNLLTWSNAKYNILKTGDVVYFSVLPKNSEKTGKIKYSIPVEIS